MMAKKSALVSGETSDVVSKTTTLREETRAKKHSRRDWDRYRADSVLHTAARHWRSFLFCR